MAQSISLAICVLASLQEDDSRCEGNRFTSKFHDLTLSIPKDWGSLLGGAEKFKAKNGLCEGTTNDATAGFFLAFEPLGWTTDEYLPAREKAMEKNELRKTAEARLPGRGREFVRCDYDWPYPKAASYYAAVFTTRGKNTYRLCLWWHRAEEARHRQAIESILRSFRPLGVDFLPNPWAGFGKGSWAEYRSDLKIGDTSQTSVARHFLTDPGDGTYCEYRIDLKQGSSFTPGKPERADLRAKPTTGKVETDEEEIEVPAGKFRCRWRKTTFDDGWVQIWSRDLVPGGTVRMTGERMGIRTTMVLTAWEKK
jgi:hypothetical protein